MSCLVANPQLLILYPDICVQMYCYKAIFIIQRKRVSAIITYAAGFTELCSNLPEVTLRKVQD